MDTLHEQHRRAMEERNRKIRALREQNIPIEEIATLYGITAQRVSKICEPVRKAKSVSA